MPSPCERPCGMYEIMGNDFVHAARSSDTETIQGIPNKKTAYTRALWPISNSLQSSRRVKYVMADRKKVLLTGNAR